MADIVGAGTLKKGWRARWYLWDEGFLTIGRTPSGPDDPSGLRPIVPPHSHHAIQVMIGLDGPLGVAEPGGEWSRGEGLMVAADVPHQFDPMGSLITLIFVDPESRIGRWLTRSFRTPVVEIPRANLEPWIPRLRSLWEEPLDLPETAALIHGLVRDLCPGPPPLYRLDERIVRALEIIREADSAKLSLESVARAVYLSPSRFAHLFSEEVGLPFRRFVLWRRLTRAMLIVGRGHTLSAAAHLCGFADSAHLTRACVQMFGQAPSLLMQAGEFYEIPGPLEVTASASNPGGGDDAAGGGQGA
jgi:AraC family transcriptional regulator